MKISDYNYGFVNFSFNSISFCFMYFEALFKVYKCLELLYNKKLSCSKCQLRNLRNRSLDLVITHNWDKTLLCTLLNVPQIMGFPSLACRYYSQFMWVLRLFPLIVSDYSLPSLRFLLCTCWAVLSWILEGIHCRFPEFSLCATLFSRFLSCDFCLPCTLSIVSLTRGVHQGQKFLPL